MKKLLAMLLTACMVLSLAACSGDPAVTTGGEDTGTEGGYGSTAADTTAAAAARENKLVYASTAGMYADLAAGLIRAGAWNRLNDDITGELLSVRTADTVIGSLLSDYGTLAPQRDGTYAYNMAVLAQEPTATANPDGTKTFTLRIREDLTYNTGKAITAGDYVFGTLFVNSAACAVLGEPGMNGELYPSGKAFYNCTSTVLADIRLIDEYSWSVTISPDKLPYVFESTYISAFPWDAEYWFGSGYAVADSGQGCYLAKDGEAVLMDAALAAAVSETFSAASSGKTLPMVTAGPYQLVDYDAAGKQATLEINPNYAGNFEGQKPSIRTLVITSVTDGGEALKDGSAHLWDTVSGGEGINAVLDLIDGGGELTYDVFDRAGYGELRFACDATPTQFLEVRQALAHLLDREALVNLFCQGWGTVVNGPYSDAFWMADASAQRFGAELDPYAFDVDAAEKLLNQGGWVWNAEGGTWDGEGLRYREVTREQAGDMEECIEADGRILMPLVIKWAASANNPVSDLLTVLLAESEGVARLGMEIQKDVMDFSSLLGYLCRRDVCGVGGTDFSVPKYSMFNLAVSYGSALYDCSNNWTDDPAHVAAAYNTNFLYDTGENGLDQLSMDMVRGVAEGDRNAYLAVWQDYVLRWNELLPSVPLYVNRYVTAYPTWLQNYDQDTFWGFAYAILYASIEDAQ